MTDEPVPTPPQIPAQIESGPSPEEESQRRKTTLTVGISVSVVLILLIASLVALLHPGITSPDTVARIRDVFIIFLALESLLIGFVLVILIVQIARLTNLLQNEIKPILNSTNETVSTLRGTAQFLSDNLSEPIIVINEFLAALKQLGSILGLGRKN